jgi:PhzF family phenazine biosynthesis protein
MSVPIFQIDAFTDRPFAGNPAAVCVLSEPRDDSWLQGVAGEMNLSETAFLTKEADGFRLRWFTPRVEVALCGHATLASAHILFQEGLARSDETIRFLTLSGVLTANRKGEEIELDFPLEPDEPIDSPANLAKALGVPLKYVGKNRFDYLVEVDSVATLRRMTPDFKLLTTVTQRGVIVTSRSSESRFDFMSRFFAPGVGIDEDPVTGSAHCCLGAYWRRQLGKSEFLAFQASARGGVVRVRVDEKRAYLGGKAVTVLKGELLA